MLGNLDQLDHANRPFDLFECSFRKESTAKIGNFVQGRNRRCSIRYIHSTTHLVEEQPCQVARRESSFGQAFGACWEISLACSAGEPLSKTCLRDSLITLYLAFRELGPSGLSVFTGPPGKPGYRCSSPNWVLYDTPQSGVYLILCR